MRQLNTNVGTMKTYLGIKEERVRSPRERPVPPVEEVVFGGLREFTAVLLPHMLEVSHVFAFGVVYPYRANGDW